MPKRQSSQTPRRIPTIRTVQFETQTPNQEKFVKNIEKNVVSFGIGYPGCQPAGSKVLMSDGSFKNIEDIKVGDKILSPQYDDSVQIQEITKCFKFENIQTYDINFKGRRKGGYTASYNHIIPIKYLKSGNIIINGKRKRPQTQTLTEMEVEQFLLKGNRFKATAKIFSTPAYDLPEKNYLIHPYVLGCILGDACITKYEYNSFSPRFIYTVHEIKERMEKNGCNFSLPRLNNKNKFNLYDVAIIGETKNNLSKLNLEGLTSHTKFIPEEYLQGSLKQRLELLAGLIDTDGSIDSFTSTSEILANQFKHLIFSVGGTASIKQRTTRCNGKNFDSFRVFYSFAEHQPDLIVSHKNQNKRNMNWKNNRNCSFEISENKIQTVYGFSLTGESKWYITNDFIVTHNTGKTYLALATALKALVEQKCERVVITRPMVESGPSIGFQPGNEQEKLGVYLKHIYDMIYKLLPKVLADDLLDSGKISIGAITFMRGMNFENSYVIIDEAENLDKKSFYLLLTRICEGSKMIFCGDTGQVDLKNPSESGLNDAVLKFQGKENFSVTEFTIEDCRRSKVVMEVIKAYFPNSTKTK